MTSKEPAPSRRSIRGDEKPAKYRAESALLLSLLTLVVAACTPQQQPVDIRFEAHWNGATLACDSDPVSLTDLRLFVSNIEAVDGEGNLHEVILEPDGAWQQLGIGLVDLEDGTGRCQNGTRATNPVLSGTSRAQEIVALRFTVGVPFGQNHADPLVAEPPLDNSAMHWHWRSGYKFLRAGVATENDGFWLHLGSTGCEGTVRNISGCSAPNRVSVELSGFSRESNTVAIDLASLFQGVDLDDGNRGDCSSSPSESSCEPVLRTLGLGTPDDERAAQGVFGTVP